MTPRTKVIITVVKHSGQISVTPALLPYTALLLFTLYLLASLVIVFLRILILMSCVSSGWRN